MTDGGFPIFEVGDGPDPRVKVGRGISLDIDSGDGWVPLPNPTRMVIRGLLLIESDVIPPNTALVVSGPLYDVYGNLRPQTLITDIGGEADE